MIVSAMEAAFELPIQLPMGDKAVVFLDQLTVEKLPLPHSRAVPPRVSPSSSARTKPRRRNGSTGSTPETAAAADGALHELRFRRAASSGRDADRYGARGTAGSGSSGRTKTRRTSSHAIPKSLLPLAERKSQEENKLDRLSKKDTLDTDKWDIAPDGSSAGREGRQFTVANVGNNGRIYLRPTIRPAHLRSPQPNFVFPMTPPGTAGLDLLAQDRDKQGSLSRRPQQQQEQKATQGRPTLQLRLDDAQMFYGSDWTPDQASSPTALPLATPRFNLKVPRSANAIRPTTAGAIGARPGGGHRRAVSDSTIQDTSIARESEPGGFKIVITQPTEEQQRAKTLEDLERRNINVSVPHLEVAIPSWKLGTPRFSMRGTPILRGSSYTPTEEPSSSRPSCYLSHLREDMSCKPVTLSVAQSPPRPHLDDPTKALRVTYHSTHAAIEPAMFDALTFKPACDARSIVRFSPTTHAITAATPPRLVAEITSPKFMDYDLVSDFFLTYRAFLEPHDLLRMLVARLRWAMARDDEVGMVVRVRTFVALRHWILNYFMDDFVVDYSLRVLFCDLLNGFVDELAQDTRGHKVQLKILTELKKCWRRSCAQYWDGPDFDDALGPDVPISAGGIAGHRNLGLDPSFWEQVVLGDLPHVLPDDSDDDSIEKDNADSVDDHSDFLTHPQNDELSPPTDPGDSIHSPACQRAGDLDSIMLGGGRPSTPENHSRTSELYERRHASPGSITSLDFVSCSFPTKNMRLLQAGMGHSLGAHPVDPSLVYNTNGPVAMVPRTLVGKRARPGDSPKSPGAHTYGHKRNNSLSDSLREHVTATERLLQKNTELLMSLPYAGSLVRGAIFPPGQPYVELHAPGTRGSMSRQTTIFQTLPDPAPESIKEKASAMSSQGMRKLLGSVRRALSTRGHAVSPTQGNFINISPLGPRGATTNRLPGTAIVPQARPQLNGNRPPVRIDLLGAKIAEDFKVAVREDASIDVDTAQKEADTLPTADEPQLPILPLQQPNQADEAIRTPESLFSDWAPGTKSDWLRPMSDTGITTGSKSIVIVDGTMPLDFPAMAGALPMANSSADAFGDTFLSVAADPTPPTTPPGQSAGTPRRSSYILGQHVVPPSLATDPLPPFVPDLNTLGNVSVSATAPPLAIAETNILPRSEFLDPDDESIVLPRPSVDDCGDAIFTNNNFATNSFGMPSSPPIRMPQRSWTDDLSRQSKQSYGSRRSASFSSDITPHAQAQSVEGCTHVDNAPTDGPIEEPLPQPLRILRRRPGGDLRAVTNVGDLDQAVLRRSHSVGSLTTYSESIRSSSLRSPNAHGRSQVVDSNGFVDVISVDFSQEKENTFSVGMLADKKPTKRASVFSTCSSRPVMRPSFEAEAQKLAQIPDDADDDGGVESALLKLEGKFERKTKKLSFSELPPTQTTRIAKPPLLSGFFVSQAASHDQHAASEEKPEHRHRHILQRDLVHRSPPPPSKLGQFTTTASIDADVDSSQYGTVALRKGSVTATISRASGFSPPPELRPTAVPRMADDIRSFLTEGSGESYSSIPLLDRGLTDDGRSRGATADEVSNRSVLGVDSSPSSSQTPIAASSAAVTAGRHNGLQQHPHSYEFVEKTGTVKNVLPGDTMPQSPGQMTEQSFLDDASDRGSDLSSELSVDFLDDEDDDEGIYSQVAHTAGSRLPAHPLGDPQREPTHAVTTPAIPSFQEQHPGKLVEEPVDNHPPSPPITLVQALQMSPDTAYIPELHDSQLWAEKPLPPTPGPDGTVAAGGSMSRSKKQPLPESATLDGAGRVARTGRTAAESEVCRKLSVHLPFILAFESEVLAQQFTLIEKDALHEIDWKELIEMRWKNAENSDARSWVDFLRNTDARGVEVVIARFNIMVKWAISEIVLTQELEERARCLIKFIHIAAHCRRHRNFATMSQIAIALTTNEVSRLTTTWALVPASDVRTLRELEALVSPTRNFYSLRAEMEAVGIDNADTGCIPFVGIYTHDLLFNAQRPSEIASSPTTAPLVNFERCRFAASVVKTLLRLVEASALYDFQPIEGITERCLWMSALSDDDIRRYSEALE